MKNSYNNNQRNISQISSKNINKLLINNYYYKLKTYVVKTINKSQRSEDKKRKKEKDNYLTIVLPSMPKKIISTPTYKKPSGLSSPLADSTDKKKENSRYKISYKKIKV